MIQIVYLHGHQWRKGWMVPGLREHDQVMVAYDDGCHGAKPPDTLALQWVDKAFVRVRRHRLPLFEKENENALPAVPPPPG